MACDCGQLGYDEIFNDRTARHELRRFRRRGLGTRARRLVRAVEGAAPIANSTVLEIGAGIGAVTVTLLEHGVASAETVDAVPAFVGVTRELASQRGFGGRLTAHAGNFADEPEAVSAADVVVLDRVICCYPELYRLLQPAARHARQTIALTYPRDAWWARALVRIVNAAQRLLGRRFRMHFHPPVLVHRVLADEGLAPRIAGHAGFWEILVASRSPSRARG